MASTAVGTLPVTFDPPRQGGLGSLAVCEFREGGYYWWAPRLGVHPPGALVWLGSYGMETDFPSAGPCM